MKKLKDKVHNCEGCNPYPCTTQPFIESSICSECSGMCCHSPLVPLLPCEQKSDLIKKSNINSVLIIDGYCFAYNKENNKCKIHNYKPIACRVATCRFVREGKLPEQLRR